MPPTVNSDQTLLAVVRRQIKAGQQERFAALMRDFTTFVLRQPGHVAITILQPDPNSREVTVLDRFSSIADRHQFVSSPEYSEWMERLREVSESEPEILEAEGLDFWFTVPGRPARLAPSRYKMALLTLLGVYPLSLIVPWLVSPLAGGWPLWARGFLIASILVASLTWLVMPQLTCRFESWLYPTHEGDSHDPAAR